MRAPLVLVATAAALGLAACAGGGEDEPAQTSTRPQPAAGQPPQCRTVAAPRPKPQPNLPAPTLRLDPEKTYRAAVDTNCGSFTIALDVRNSPKTTASFVSLVRSDFYDNLTFHRVVKGFVIQGGDPLGNGTGGPGYQVVEPPPRTARYRRGVVAMAKAEAEDPGTSGSQFYVVTADDAQLPPDYAVLGRVVDGQETVDAIGLVATYTGPDPARTDRPNSPVVIRDIRIVEG